LKPHNNVEIAVRKRSHVIVHVNRLKPYLDDSKFQTFTDNFQKQGGNEDFDFLPTDEEKIEIKKPEMQTKRKSGCPKKVIVQDHSDSEEEARFPMMEEARYTLRQNRPEMERVRRQSERPEYFETEKESDSESEDNDEAKVQGYDPDSSSWIVRKLRDRIEWEINYLYNICSSISSVLKLKTRKALYTFISTFLTNHVTNHPQIEPQP
jgi:hypothetical protein